ncbi:hypothetical protein GCM10027294_34960 [Marinactinospora endophytica]
MAVIDPPGSVEVDALAAVDRQRPALLVRGPAPSALVAACVAAVSGHASFPLPGNPHPERVPRPQVRPGPHHGPRWAGRPSSTPRDTAGHRAVPTRTPESGRRRQRDIDRAWGTMSGAPC